MDPVGDGTPSKASPDRSVRIPNTNIEHLESPSTLESSPRKIAGWNLSLDLDSSDVEDLDDDNDADTMERSTCSTLEGVEVARPEPDIVESEKVMVQHQQPTTLGLCEHAWESVVDVDAKPPAHKTSPKDPTLRAATKKCHGNGTISDPICLDDNVFETSVERDLILKIGHPVYSPFPGTNPLHEGAYFRIS